MKNILVALIVAGLPLIVVIFAFYVPMIPPLTFFVGILFLALIFGSVQKWDVSAFTDKTADILKAEAAMVVFGISLGSLVLTNLKDIIDVNRVIGVLLLSSGFFTFSMIFGVLHLLMRPGGMFKKWAGWAMLIALFYGLFLLLLGWSYMIKPIFETLLK